MIANSALQIEKICFVIHNLDWEVRYDRTNNYLKGKKKKMIMIIMRTIELHMLVIMRAVLI